jgi:hypothetical protein
MGVKPHAFLIFALDGGEWSATMVQQLYPQGKRPHYPLERRLGGPQSLYGHSGEEKNISARQESNPGHHAHSLVPSHYTD